MTKKEKFLFYLSIFAFFLILYFVITSEPDKSKNSQLSGSEEKASVDLVALENDYKREVKIIFNDYENLLEQDFNINQISETRLRLLNLTVPAQFKDLHLNLVMAMLKMEQSLDQQSVQDKTDSNQIISQLKANYNWLN